MDPPAPSYPPRRAPAAPARRGPAIGGAYPPRPRSPMGPRSPGPPPPAGWRQPRPQPRARSHRPPQQHGVGGRLIIGLVAITVLGAGWYFFVRSDGPTSTFIRANQRFVEAARTALAAEADVQRFLELPEFATVVQKQKHEMERNARILERIAKREDDEAGQIANEAATAAHRTLTTVDKWLYAITTSRNLTNAQSATAQINASLAELERLRGEWEALSK